MANSRVIVNGLNPELLVEGNKQTFYYDGVNQNTKINIKNTFDFSLELPANNTLELSTKTNESFRWTVSQVKRIINENQPNEEGEGTVDARPEYTLSYYREPTQELQYQPKTIFNVQINNLTDTTYDGVVNCNVPIDMSQRPITNLPPPTNTTDAVNKAYVDTLANGGTPLDTSNFVTTSDFTTGLNGILSQLENRFKAIPQSIVSGALLRAVPITLPVSTDSVNWQITGCDTGKIFVLWYPSFIYRGNNQYNLNTDHYYVYFSVNGSTWQRLDLLEQNIFLTTVANEVLSYDGRVYPKIISDGYKIYCLIRYVTDNTYQTDGSGKINATLLEFNDELKLSKPTFTLNDDIKVADVTNKYAKNDRYAFILVKNNYGYNNLLGHDLVNSTWFVPTFSDSSYVYIENIFYNKANGLFYALGRNKFYYCSSVIDIHTFSPHKVGIRTGQYASEGIEVTGSVNGAYACCSEQGTIFIPNNTYFRTTFGNDTLPSDPFSNIIDAHFFYAGFNRIGVIVKTADDTQTDTPGNHYLYMSRDEGKTWIKCDWLVNETSNLARTVTVCDESLEQPNAITIIYNHGSTNTDKAYVIV